MCEKFPYLIARLTPSVVVVAVVVFVAAAIVVVAMVVVVVVVFIIVMVRSTGRASRVVCAAWRGVALMTVSLVGVWRV